MPEDQTDLTTMTMYELQRQLKDVANDIKMTAIKVRRMNEKAPAGEEATIDQATVLIDSVDLLEDIARAALTYAMVIMNLGAAGSQRAFVLSGAYVALQQLQNERNAPKTTGPKLWVPGAVKA